MGRGGGGPSRRRPRDDQRSGPGARADGASGADVGALGGAACGPAISAPATCWPRRPKTPAWFPASPRPVIPPSTMWPTSGARPSSAAQPAGSARRRPTVARRRLRAWLGDGQVHPQGVPGLRLLCAGVRGPRADVRRVRQRVVGRRPRGRRRIRVRRTFGHPRGPGDGLAAVPPYDDGVVEVVEAPRHRPPTRSRRRRQPRTSLPSNPPTST